MSYQITQTMFNSSDPTPTVTMQLFRKEHTMVAKDFVVLKIQSEDKRVEIFDDPPFRAIREIHAAIYRFLAEYHYDTFVPIDVEDEDDEDEEGDEDG